MLNNLIESLESCALKLRVLKNSEKITREVIDDLKETIMEVAKDAEKKLNTLYLITYQDLSEDELLEALASERMPPITDDKGNLLPYKMPDADHKERMKTMIKQLINRGVYPAETVKGNPNDIYEMVDDWGAYWHKWKEPLECPKCKVDLRNHITGPPFKREIANIVNDRLSHRTCPDCKAKI